MSNCIFCKIVNKEIPSDIIYEDDTILAFKDLSPQAPVHILFIPKNHIENIDSLTESDNELIGHIFSTIGLLSNELGLEEGYRVVVNNGSRGGQTVGHLHFHVLGGRSLQWPPG